jgi:hypothetical protein
MVALIAELRIGEGRVNELVDLYRRMGILGCCSNPNSNKNLLGYSITQRRFVFLDFMDDVLDLDLLEVY